MKAITLAALAAVSLAGCSSELDPNAGAGTEEQAEAPPPLAAEPELEPLLLDSAVTESSDSSAMWNTALASGGGGAGGRYASRRQKDSSESYAAFPESGFQLAILAPFSTFGVDVDSASWANVRRLLRDSELPPAGAVRIEELVNAFVYDYPPPEDRQVALVFSQLFPQ